MKRIRFTAEQIHAFHPCRWDCEDNGENYTLAQIQRLLGRRKTATFLTVARHQGIPDADKVWAIMRMLESTDRVEYVEAIVRPVVRQCCLHCGVGTTERWARAWLRGAKWARTTAAARAAVAAADAAEAADSAAAYAAAADYAAVYANAAARAAERKRQVNLIIQMATKKDQGVTMSEPEQKWTPDQVREAACEQHCTILSCEVCNRTKAILETYAARLEADAQPVDVGA